MSPPPELLMALVKTGFLMGAYAQLLGMPVAWLRLRKTDAWEGRPAGTRRIDLLAEFILWPTALAVVWGLLAVLLTAIGGLGFSNGAFLLLIGIGPALFVPWAVLRIDRSRLSRVVAEARED